MIFNRSTYLVVLGLLFFSDASFAQELGRADQALNSTISNFVLSITTDRSSDFYKYVRSMMLGLAFIGLAWHVVMWTIKDITIGELVIYVFTSMIVFTVYVNYNSTISAFWSWSDGIAAGIQKEAVGTSDILFISNKLQESTMMFFLTGVSIWDGIHAIISMIAFKFITMVLSIVIFVISMWSIWGYAFCKITGLVFLPLMFLPITRGFFEKWFQILLGFWFFNMFSKVALTLYYLYFQAIFGAISSPLEFDPIGDRLALGRILLHFIVGIFFLLASGGLASMMASGFGGVSSKASSGAAKAAALATKMITKV